jgi:two-component system response regulator MprA
VRILVVDDEPAVADGLERVLRLDGHQVVVGRDGVEGLRLAESLNLDAMVLDVLMPGLDGIEVCRRLRAAGSPLPILMLTARDAIDDRVEGLDVGADDYLTKPFAVEELRARVRALLRRGAEEKKGAAVLAFDDVWLDLGTYEAARRGRAFELSHTEFKILELFLRNPRQVLSRDLLEERVWGSERVLSSNSLEVHIGSLRRKMEAGGEPRMIQTVRGAGYVLRSA